MAHETVTKGRHAELLAMTALLSSGWTVMEPIAPEAFDLAIRKPDDKRTYYVQVKSVTYRNEAKYNGEWLIVKGAKNNGKVYSANEADHFIAVWRGCVYMFPNGEQKEYWVRPWQADERWTKLATGIENLTIVEAV